MEHYDLLIVGGGAAGISAAKAARRAGCASIAVVDRKPALGGVLLQCVHRGFGDGCTGPEFVRQLLEDFPPEIRVISGRTVLKIEESKVARLSGGRSVSFDRLILAAGCREVPMGALPIAGTRPAGIYTVGQMQEMISGVDVDLPPFPLDLVRRPDCPGEDMGEWVRPALESC